MANDLTFGSLFAGIGGFDLGFERAGFACRWQVEIDDYATKILEKHWPKVRRQRDIRECSASNLERVDCIIGGFPCQDISCAGSGAGIDGERSRLFFEVIRLARQLHPRAIVLENSSALLARGLDRVLGSLAQVGYDAEWHCIPATAVGAAHVRDRVFIIATLADSNGKRLEERKGQDAKGAGSTIGTVISRSSWWDVEPNVGRVAYGIPGRVDRLRCLGNAIVPQVAEVVARMTKDILDGD